MHVTIIVKDRTQLLSSIFTANLPVTEGKKIANRMKKDVVMSDLTSPWYSPAFTPGETSSFLRYLLSQLSTKIDTLY